MKALRLFTLALTLALTPALVCTAYAQDDDDATEQTAPSSKKKDKKKDKKADKKKDKKKGVKKVGAFKMEKKGFKKVIEKAKAANVPVMVLFTNPPTCPYCVKLEQEVLNNAQWKKGVNGKILCIYIDFACKDPKAQELSAKFPHQGIPTYFFMNPHTGDSLGPSGGYLTGRPIETYVQGVDYACEAMKRYVEEQQAKEGDASEDDEES